MKKTIVIFANSIKHNQHCVAGKCLKTKEWIRPVSNALGRELSNNQATYTNNYGKYIVKPKQKIEMNFIKHVPILHQPDNFLIDTTQWSQKYSIKDYEINQYLDTPESLWGDRNSISYNLISTGKIVIHQSLYLVKIENLHLYTLEQKRRAKFSYYDVSYDFPVTDPNFDNIMREGTKTLGVLCISLGENFNGYCYKIVATIF